MPQGLALTSFTGGLNLRRNEFSLGEGESPDMLNVEVDERTGFYTRPGWERWNAVDIVGSPTGVNWDPKHAYLHPLSDGTFYVFVANGTTIYASTGAATFSDLSVTVGADPHLADFASWGDICYMTAGHDNQTIKKDGAAADTLLSVPGNGTYNDDYTNPVGGYMPKAEYVEAHSGYIFVAYIEEDVDGGGDADYPNRIRWSHPDQAEDWAELDYIDIQVGGGRITGLKSFGDHLLIFKEDSVWALYGYDSDSWQLIRISLAVGCPNPAAITRSPGAVFFFSPSSTRPGVYAYLGQGDPEYISEPLETAFEALGLDDLDDVYVGWTGRRLWVSIPWNGDDATLTYPGSVFVLDPSIGGGEAPHGGSSHMNDVGAWMMHRPALGKLNGIIEGADVLVDHPLGVMHGDSGAACLVELDAVTSAAQDQILAAGTQSEYETRYRTKWIIGEGIELRKSWLRPRYVVGVTAVDVTINVATFIDYDESAPIATQYIDISADGTSVWNGTTWNGGTWNAAPNGSVVTRTRTGSKLALARSVSLRFSTNSGSLGKHWSVSGIEMKLNPRKFTT